MNKGTPRPAETAAPWYIADVSVKDGVLGGQVGKTLQIRLLNYGNKGEVFVRAVLFGHETVAQMEFDPPLNTLRSGTKLIHEVARDLVNRTGVDDHLNWEIENIDKLPELDDRFREFETHWKCRAFGNALRAYGVTDRLTLEQARCVLEEHYVIEPIMES